MFDKILVVCVGNICRSPTAERVLQKFLPTLQVESAGLDALVGQAIEPTAARILDNKGFNSSDHLGRKVTGQMVRDADLVLVMEVWQQQRLMKEFPAISGKVMLLGQWQDGLEINDPYKKSEEAFEAVFKQIEQACKLWVRRLG